MPRPVARSALLSLGVLLGLTQGGVSGCATDPSPASHRCVFERFTDSAAMAALLKAWSEEAKLGEVTRWGVKIVFSEAKIDMETTGWTGTVSLRLEGRCENISASAVTIRGQAPTRASLSRLARDFPAPRRRADAPPGQPSQGVLSTTGAFHFFGLALILLALGMEAPSRRRPWLRRSTLALLWAGCGALALWSLKPLFTAAYASDAPVLRMAFARESPFGDWNHPFLPYLLNHPVARFTMEPWALRVVPFLWILAQLGLLIALAARWGRTLVMGALAGLWMVYELPSRPSIDELSDWDLAGAFLLGLVACLAWLEGRGARAATGAPSLESVPVDGSPGAVQPIPGVTADRRTLAVLLGLMALGFFSSYMMIVPLGVLLLVLWLLPETRPHLALPATALYILLAIRAMQVFFSGRESCVRELSLDQLLTQIAQQLPLTRNAFMALVMAAGVIWLLHRAVRGAPGSSPGRGTALLLLGSLLAIPSATLFAWQFSHVNNGYYSCLATPLWILAGAIALGQAGVWGNAVATACLKSRGSGRWRNLVAPLGLGFAALLVGHATLGLPIPLNESRYRESGSEHIADFDEEQRRRPLPIVTNSNHLALYMGLERVRRGKAVEGGLNPPPGPSSLLSSLRFMSWSCRPISHKNEGGSAMWTWRALGEELYLVAESAGDRALDCLTRLPLRCTRLYPERRWLNFFRCRQQEPAP